MIIKRFHLEAYGPFTDTSLEFDGHGPGLHIVYGPNESGKSSTLRALKAWLFGFPERTSDNFFHPNDQLRVSGTLCDSRGDELTFSRRKKRKGSVLDSSGNVMDQGQVRTWIQGMDQERFEALFGLDHAGLVQGGTSILQEKGSAGTTLFSAGTGIASLEHILQELRDERRAIFKPQGSKPELNASLKRYREIKTEIKKATLSSHAWKEQERALRQAESDLEQARFRKKEVQEEQQRLQRLQQALHPLARLREARSRLDQMGPVPLLPDDFADRRQEYQELLRQSEKTLAAARKRLADDQAKVESIDLNTELLDQSDTIQDLHQRLGAYRKGMADRRALESSRVQERASAAAILRRIRPDLQIDEVGNLRSLLKQRREILAHGNKYDVLDKECKDSTEAFQAKQDELERCKAELDRLPQDRDISDLRHAIDAATSLGDIDGAFEKQSAEAVQKQETFGKGLLQLGFWQGSPEDLLSLPLPLESAVRQFKQEWDSLDREGQEISKKRADLSKTISDVEKQIHSHELVGDVPSEEDLKEKRAWREKGWFLLRRKWLDGEDIEAELREYAPNANLVWAYESAVQSADHTADRLRNESSRVHVYAQLQSELSQARSQWEDLERTEADVSAKWEDLKARWIKAWQPSGIEPDTPEVMSEWQGKINGWRVTAQQIVDLEAVVASQDRQRKEAREVLEKALQDFCATFPRGNALAPILILAKDTRESFEQTAQMRQKLLETVSRLEKEIDLARDRLKQANEAFKAWQHQWKEYLLLLGLPETETPSGVVDFFDELDACLNQMNEAAAYERRIRGIDQDGSALKHDVESLLQWVAPELLRLPMDQAVEGLNGLLNRAQTDQTTLKHYQESIDKTEDEIQHASSDLDHAVLQLKQLCELAGCDDQEELEAVERRWSQHQELEKKISTEEERLREIAPAHSLDDIAAEVDGIDPDFLPGRLQEVEQELEGLEEAVTEKSGIAGELRKSFQDMDGSDHAARKAEEAEEVLAIIRRQAERFARLRVAGMYLEEAIERYRAENQDPVLTLAGEYFKELTLGSFAGLRTDVDDKGDQVIVGLRDAGDRVSVAGMSDGTRDQLFLALRLASLEHRLEKSEPIPFIVDDILINFDEIRTRAALQALGRLGTKNQVLLFSHHQQVADVGLELNVGQIHYLGARSMKRE